MKKLFQSYAFQARKARALVKLVGILSRLLYGRRLAEIARTSIHSVEEWSGKEILRSNLAQLREMFPATVAKYPFPEIYPATFRRDKSFDTIHLCEFRNVVVSPHTGLFYFPDKTVLQESVGGLIRILGWGKHIHEMLMPFSKDISEHCVIAAPGGIPYFHWLLEAFPRMLKLLAQVENPVLLTSKNTPSFVKDSFAIASNHVGRNIPVIESDFSVLAGRAAFIQCDDWSGFVHPAIVSQLRDLVSSVTRGILPAKLIYVSRRRAKLRSIKNEEEIEGMLVKLGFEICFMEDMGLQKQWKTFASARVVVSPHGAALSNLVGCHPSAKVLELFQNGVTNDCYARLSMGLGLHYQYQETSSEQSPISVVNIRQLQKTVEALL